MNYQKNHELFIQENLREFKYGYPADPNFVRNFNDWCRNNGYKTRNAGTVNDRFKQLCEHRRIQRDGSRKWYFVLMKDKYQQFKEDDNEICEEEDESI